MSCGVAVLSVAVTQVVAGSAAKIVIAGTVRDCAKNQPSPHRPDEVWVDVDVSVLVNGQPDPSGTATVTANVPPPAAGVDAVWSVQVKGLPPVPCGEQIRVRASCHTDASCADERVFTLDCGCPDVSFDVDVAPACNADGTRTAIFTIGLTSLPSTGTPVFGTIHLGDGVAGSAMLPVQFPGPQWTAQGNTATGVFSFDYLPGSYSNVSFEISFPTSCAAVTPLSSGLLDVDACPRPNCPSEVFLEVRNAAGTPVASGADAPCLPAGDYTVVATEPSAIGRSYTWSVDGQIDGAPNVNGVSRNSYRRTVTAGSQSTISVAVASPGCDGVATGAVALAGCTAAAPPEPPLRPMPSLCEIARIAGLALFIVGCVLIFAGACTGNVPLAGAGAALAAAGLVILVIWSRFCAPFSGGCLMLQRLIEGLELVAIALPVIALILAAVGMYPCGIGVLIDWGLVGTLLAILSRIFRAVPCRFQ